MYSLDDTIAAVASPPGGAARGIIRISGPNATDCLRSFFQAETGQSLAELEKKPPCAVAGSLHLAELGSPLPCDAFFWSARSYTGQPVVELHTLGSPPLLQLVLRHLCAAGARLAGPGEFTLRAFLAGRIDLTQAEAVLGVIDAEDDRQLHAALGQLAGGLARPLGDLRNSLLDLLAHLEAGFDFADEDLPFIAREELERRLADAQEAVAAVLRQMASRSDVTEETRIVLAGRPNVGKSSLFNAMLGDRAALVSPSPGTTRDYLNAELDLGGVKCRWIDTAGVGSQKPLAVSHDGTIDHAAQKIAAEQHQTAHVQVLCIDSTRPMNDWERKKLEKFSKTADPKNRKNLVVLTKCDAPCETDCAASAIKTSSRTGQGLDILRAELRRRALAARGDGGEVVAGTVVRCHESLGLAGESLRLARDAAAAGQEELAASEIRVALEALGQVVGAVYTEDVLDRIFSRFCVGK